MKISVVLNDEYDADVISWIKAQRNQSRAIVRVLKQEVTKQTTLSLTTDELRTLIDDVVRTALREEKPALLRKTEF